MTRSNPLTLVARCCVFSFFLLLTAHCSLFTAYAQSATATVGGTIEDQNGAVVPGVSITIQNRATSLERQATTNDSGQFTIPLLSPGTYTITARHDGFTTAEIRDVVLNVGDQKAFKIELRTGNINETVNVTAETPLINESAAVGTVVDRQFVGNLPLNGRTFQSLITLSPGVVLTSARESEQGQFSVNGQRANANYFMVDGVSANIGVGSNNVGQYGGGSLPGVGVTGGTNSLVSVDALQEFKIETSTYAAEFGRSPGAQVSIVTRSGTNQFHGTVFEYFRNDALDAADWFVNASNLSKPPLRQNDFGGVFGGPLIKNRLFFFFSYEGLRLRQPQVATTDVPSSASRQTAPAALQPFLNAYPIPNGPNTINGLARFSASFSNPSRLDATSIRIDQIVNSKLTVFGRYNNSPSETVPRGGSLSLSTLSPTQVKIQTLTLGATQSIRPTVSNEVRFNYSKQRAQTSFFLDALGGAVPLPDALIFPSFASSDRSLFTFGLTGISGFRVGRNADNAQRQINLVDNLSVIRGAHQLKFGFDYRHISPTSGLRDYTQGPNFSGIGSGATPAVGTILSGKASSVAIAAIDTVTLSFNDFSAYAQDTWKVIPRLVLTYGLRWEINPPPKGTGGQDLFTLQGLDNPATLSLAPKGTPLFRTNYNNFAPRVGVAFQLSQAKGRETILRGGVGIFYDLITGAASDSLISFPYLRSKVLRNVTYPLTDPTQAVPPDFSLTPVAANMLGVFDPAIKLPRVYQWNVAVEQYLGPNQTVSATYVAAVGRRLLRREQSSNPNPSFATVNITRNTATSDYHAFQLQYNRRLARRIQALGSYTWSHSIDIASGDTVAANATEKIDPALDRGPSDFDIRHAMSLAVTYNIPSVKTPGFGKAILRDWSLDTIFTARTAEPVNIFSSRDIGSGVLRIRPDLVLGVPLYSNDPTVGGGKRINRAAFVIPTVNRQGTLGRNALRGFSLSQLDLALHRQFNLSERVKLHLRAEFFNILNHPNFADPSGNLASGQFGQSPSMFGRNLSSTGIGVSGLNPLYQIGGSRSIQFALKLAF
jgi:outer membrane receptor protein involved in Fe transport